MAETAPPLTLPPEEARALRSAYAGADTILEYGSGGSTVLAAGMAGKTVFSVESDAGFLTRLQDWFAANPPAARLHLHHADIGPTADWGRPADESAFRKWPGYPISVWDRADFVHPDVVLIDGRFRVACLLTTAFRILRPVVALFDDYAPRRAYHAVETLLRPAAMVGRMARFDLVPLAVPADRLAWVLRFYGQPV
ncbi:MAG: hypothetical protein IE927_08180 [Rhodobacterales bacterium]|nr:hypothetical protein [Rhodobacterales bacterium]